MIPKNCMLTDKGKLEATLKGRCEIYCAPICLKCAYCDVILRERQEMYEAMEKWAGELKTPVKVSIY